MSDFTINGLSYCVIENTNEVELHRTEGLKRPVRNIPAEVEYNGKKYKVTRVSHEAFKSDDILTNISLPETIKKIIGGDYIGGFYSGRYYGAFCGCKKLKEIYFPSSLEEIGKFSFRDCITIDTLYFGDNLNEIGNFAFQGCTALKEIDFNDKLEYIGVGAFRDCSSLKNVSFPMSLRKIGTFAFRGCKAMTEVNIPASVEEIDSSAFEQTGVKVVNIYSENINIASSAFPSDAQINFLDANSFPKHKRKPRGAKTIETPKINHIVEEPMKPAPKPVEKSVPKPVEETTPKPVKKPVADSDNGQTSKQGGFTAGDMCKLQLKESTTVEELRKEFNDAFGANVKIYNGNNVANLTDTLGSLGLTAEGVFECRSSLTVASFIERMQVNHSLKVKVFTCDEWVAVLDGLTLKSAGLVKKNATKADMESMIAYQRTNNDLQGYTLEAREDGGYIVRKDGVECENAKAAMREIAGMIGLAYEASWTTRQFGAKLLKAIGK